MVDDIDIQAELKAYTAEREKLIAEERSLRHDSEFIKTLSETEHRACQIISKIRDHEAATVWEKDLNSTCHPGMMFTLAKARMEGTQLWKIVKRMPKGALLHAHLEAMVDIEWFWDVVYKTPGMCMFSDRPLADEEAWEYASITFQFVKESVKSGPSIWSADYVPNTPVPMKSAADSFPSSSRYASFFTYLHHRTTITPQESLAHHEGINAIWRKFQSIFRVLNPAVYYEPIFRKFVAHLLEALYQDGVNWVDFRAAMHMQFVLEGGDLPEDSQLKVLQVLHEESEKFKKKTNGDFWGVRMIWTSLRSLDPALIKENMARCIELKKVIPHMIAGYDLVGQEDLGHSHLELIDELLWFRKKCEKEGVDIPFYFHAGETNSSGGEADMNLYDVLLLGTRRIGHGYSLYRHPHLLNLCRSRGICIEVCPISNEVLRLTSSILGHPLPALLANGVPTTINNDDPGILGQGASGSLSHDYWQVLQAYDDLGLHGIGALAETSVRYAAYEKEEEAEVRLKEWRGKWSEFCEWVVKEFQEWA